MKILYSNMLPLSLEDHQQTIVDSFMDQIKESDIVEIAVGYVSKASLLELDNLVESNHITHISLVIGMYYLEGMPEDSYHLAIKINKKWQDNNIGEIRLVEPLKYHGKIYCFEKNGECFSSIIGSANLGVISPDANNRRQYEVSSLTKDPEECRELLSLVKRLEEPNCSANIADIDPKKMTLIREQNVSLDGIDTVEQMPPKGVDLYFKHKTNITFELPIKVPSFSERFMDDGKHYTKSNINVCYAAPRNKRKPRDWYETQMTVSKEITRLPGYPIKNKPFFVVTDDGYWFKAHTTSDGNKQFSAVGDELIMGRWLKGRLAAAGLVNPVNDTQKDTERLGMITKEMLQEYGCDIVRFTKTDQQAQDEDGAALDVWTLSFENKEQKKEANR